MSLGARLELEQRVRASYDAGDLEKAATLALDGYGPEVGGFIMAFHRSEADVVDVYSAFSEDLWRGLASFAWNCSLRTWLFTLARNASSRFLRQGRRHRVGRAGPNAVDDVEARPDTRTHTWMRTATRDWFVRAREDLPAEDQMLLVLRGKGLEWDEVARVMGGESEAHNVTVRREAARLRKRFQWIKERLRDRA